jgi:hypothetical protein
VQNPLRYDGIKNPSATCTSGDGLLSQGMWRPVSPDTSLREVSRSSSLYDAKGTVPVLCCDTGSDRVSRRAAASLPHALRARGLRAFGPRPAMAALALFGRPTTTLLPTGGMVPVSHCSRWCGRVYLVDACDRAQLSPLSELGLSGSVSKIEAGCLVPANTKMAGDRTSSPGDQRPKCAC